MNLRVYTLITVNLRLVSEAFAVDQLSSNFCYRVETDYYYVCACMYGSVGKDLCRGRAAGGPVYGVGCVDL
jgi:hypothetical protein